MKMMTGPLALLACMASASAVLAQAVTPNVPVSTAEQGIEQALPRSNAEEAPLPGVVIEFPTQQPPANAGTLSFVLNDIVFQGAKILPPETLRSIYAEFIGTEITLLKAFEILAQVQSAHRDAGYVFTRVVAPPQAIDAGIFKIQVVEAFIGKVVIEQPEGSVGKVMPLVEKIANKLTTLKNPTLAQLERTLLLLNDIPGITQATAVPRPGDGLGAVDLYINVVRDPFSGVFFADNRQSPVLGEGIAGISFEASSYSSAGDTTTLSLFNTAGIRLKDFRERNILQIEHQRHLGAQGTVLKFRALASQNRPGDLLEDLDIEGEQFNVELSVEHPVIRTRPLSVWGSAGIEIEESTSSSNNGGTKIFDDSLRVVYIGARLLQRDAYGYTRADAQIRQGLKIFGANDESDPGSRSDGEASFTLIRGSIDREVVIPKTGNKLSVYGSAVGQYSADPLLSSEEFAAGGQLIGRAYDPSEFTGDSGYGVLGEVRYQLRFDVQGKPIGAQLYGYGDFAEITNEDVGDPHENLTSYGGGVRFSLPYDISLSGEVAIPTQALRRNNKKNPRFFFNLVKRF